MGQQTHGLRLGLCNEHPVNPAGAGGSVAVMKGHGAFEDIGVATRIRRRRVRSRHVQDIAQLGEKELVIGPFRRARRFPAFDEAGNAFRLRQRWRDGIGHGTLSREFQAYCEDREVWDVVESGFIASHCLYIVPEFQSGDQTSLNLIEAYNRTASESSRLAIIAAIRIMADTSYVVN